MSVYRDLLQHWEKTGEGLSTYQLRWEHRLPSRSGTTVKKYVRRLEKNKLAVNSKLYRPLPVTAPIPSKILGPVVYRAMQRISNVKWRVNDRLLFRKELSEHNTLKCTSSNCGYILKPALLPRRPCPRCASPMVRIYNRVLKE